MNRSQRHESDEEPAPAPQLFGFRLHEATAADLAQWVKAVEDAATAARRNGPDAVAALTYDLAIYLLSEGVRGATGADRLPLFTPEEIDTLLGD